jgi:4-carboxymuconolactone decarboxylase
MTDRLPALVPAELDEAQQELYDTIVANEVPAFEARGVEVRASDGSLLGPFNPLLFSPALGRAQLEVFRSDGASTSLSPRVHEIVILAVGAACECEYELYAHRIVGRRVGLPEDVIEALASGGTPALADEQEASAFALARELTRDHRVGPQTYTTAERAFGHRGVVDIVLLVGLYLTTCAIINAFEVAVPNRSDAARRPHAAAIDG